MKRFMMIAVATFSLLLVGNAEAKPAKNQGTCSASEYSYLKQCNPGYKSCLKDAYVEANRCMWSDKKKRDEKKCMKRYHAHTTYCNHHFKICKKHAVKQHKACLPLHTPRYASR